MDSFRLSLSRLAVVAVATGLFACADLAGLNFSEGASSSTDDVKSRSKERDDGPETGALGGDEKANTDSHVEGMDVTSALDFGTVGCGNERVEQLVISNKGDKPRDYVVVMPDDAAFSTDAALKGTLAAEETVVLPIVVRPTISGETKANIVVTSGSSFATIPAGVIGAGATLEWMTAVAAIGDTLFTAEGTTKAKLRNTGTRAATVSGFEGLTSNFKAGPTGITVAPNAEAEVELVLTRGISTSGLLSATIKPTADGLCAPAPPVTVTGRRVNNTVTVSGADWGKKDCNASPTDSRNVVVRNYSNASVRWTLETPPTFFSIEGPTTGIVPASTNNGISPGIVNVPFKASALGATPRLIEETLKIKIESATEIPLPTLSGGVHDVTLRVDVRGAVIAISPTSLAFVARRGGTAPTQSFRITNTGNETASLGWDFERTAGGPAWTGNPQSTSTSAGSSTTVRIGYQPSTDPPNTATLTPSRLSGAKICNPEALTPVTLTGSEPTGE